MGKNVDRHESEEGLYLIIGLVPVSSNPDTGSGSGEANLWVDKATGKLNYKDPTGTNHVLPLTPADDTLVAHLAGAEEITGAKTFDDATLLLSNAAKTFKSTMHSLATAARSVNLPDAGGNLMMALGNEIGGIRILTSVGHLGAGAATLTGAKVGDVVLGISNITDHATLLPTTDFEAAITVANQIQQVSVSDLSAKTIVVLLAANS